MSYLPREPLEVLACRALDKARPVRRDEGLHDNLATTSELAALVGVTDRTWKRWGSIGLLPMTADRAATALGRHPVEVWGQDWWDLEVVIR